MPIQYTAGRAEAPENYVQPGDYGLRLIEAREDTSKLGSDMIKLRLQVVLEDGSAGPVLYDYLIFTESSFWKVDHFLMACGRHPGQGKHILLDPERMAGWTCQATLAVETYEGKKSNKVAAYLYDGEPLS